MEGAQTKRLYSAVIVIILLITALSLPTPLRQYYHQAELLYYQKQWERQWSKSLDDTAQACYNYRENPDYYLKNGEINQRQYTFIKQKGYMADCDKIMSMKSAK